MHHTLKRTGAALALWLLALSAPVLAQGAPEVAFGDHLVVIPDARAKATSFWMIVKAGCRDEDHGECHGLAHYVEHLVFLGRNADHKAVGVGFFADAQTNGYTTHISTVYTQKFPLRPEGQLDDLEKLFRFHAERLVSLDFSEEDARRERGVVLQEYALRFGRSPASNFYYKMERDLHPNHPIGQAAIGSIDDINGFTTDAARAFHKKWYTVGNAMFVVHGPVEPEAVKALYDKYIGSLPARSVPDRAWLNARFDFTPAQFSEALVDKAIGQKSFWLGKTVRYEEDDARRLSEARGLLSNYLNSSLDGSPKDILVDQKSLAKSMGYVSLNRLVAGALELNVQATPEETTSDAGMAKGIADYFVGLAKTGLTGKVLDRLKKRAAEAFVQRDKQPGDVAEAIVDWLGSHRPYSEYHERAQMIASVTLEDVNLLLTALAQPGRQVTGTLAPAP